ncbi:MAG: sulfatase [Myxococcota bacterium]
MGLRILLALAGCAAEAAPAPAKPPPVILLSLDTLRADRLAAYGGTGDRMPNLDRFARESIVFETAITQANETLFSHASLLTSRYPSELGTIDYDFRIPPGTPTLQSVLGAYGWRTGAVVSGAFFSDAFGMDEGFGSFEVAKDWGSLWHAGPRALAWIDEAERGDAPWMLLVHTYDMHARYLKPPPLGGLWSDPAYAGPARNLLREAMGTERVVDGAVMEAPPGVSPLDMMANGVRRHVDGAWRYRTSPEARRARELDAADLAEVRAAYDGAAAYLDTLLGLFFAQLERRGVLDEAVVIVFSDHGEELGERGVFNHRWGLSEEVVRVPLMIRLPGGRGGGARVPGIAELTDVTPTVLTLAGATLPAVARGRPLLDAAGTVVPPTREVAYTEASCRAVSARATDGLLVFSGLGPDSPWLTEELAAAPLDGPWFEGASLAPERKDALRRWIVDARKALPPTPPPVGTGDARMKEALKERGYWEAR